MGSKINNMSIVEEEPDEKIEEDNNSRKPKPRPSVKKIVIKKKKLRS